MPILALPPKGVDRADAAPSPRGSRIKAKPYNYDAFISYSSLEASIATDIQSALMKITEGPKPLRVFLDNSDLTVNPDLWSSVEKALKETAVFVLLASPQSATSNWVQREVDHWIKAHSAKNFLLILVAGEIIWDANKNDLDWDKTTALPKCLQGVFQEEPLFLDLRWTKEKSEVSLKDQNFKQAIVEVAAFVQDREKETVLASPRPYRMIVFVTVLVRISIPLLLILGVSIVAISNLMISRMAANEASAISSVRIIGTAQATFQATAGQGEWFGNFEDLDKIGALDRSLATGKKSGYIFSVRILPGLPSKFETTAIPEKYDSFFATGRRSFYSDETFVIYQREAGTVGTREDPGKPLE